MNKCIIRPFSPISALFIFVAIMLLLPIPFLFVDLINSGKNISNIIIAPIYSIIAVWISILLLCIVLRPKIILYADKIEIVHWINGVPIDKFKFFSLPKVKKSIINYNDLKFFGGFLFKDLKEYSAKGNGFLADEWMLIMSSNIPIPIKMPKITKNLKDVILFVTADGESTIIDGGQYGKKQVEYLLFELENRTKTQSCGRVKAKKHINNIIIDIVKSMAVICWLTVIPLSTIWLESFINTSHYPAYQSVWKTIYVISIFGANLSLTGYIACKRVGNDVDVKTVKKIFKIASLVLYSTFVCAFILSVLHK